MADMNPLTYIPAVYRQRIYLGYASAGIVLGSIFAAYGALGTVAPEWLAAVQAVYGYLGTATGIIAASNVTPNERDEEEEDSVVDF